MSSEEMQIAVMQAEVDTLVKALMRIQFLTRPGQSGMTNLRALNIIREIHEIVKGAIGP